MDSIGGITSDTVPEREISTLGKILFGNQAWHGLLPWQVKLNGPEGCGGTLISNDVVITAAHCVRDKWGSTYAASRWQLTFGHIDKIPFDELSFDYNEHVRKVKRIRVHRKYNRYTNENDIAIMFLDKPVKFNNNISPACLASDNFQASHGARCVISGWGANENGRYLEQLNWAVIPILSDENCNKRLPYGWMKDSMLCAGGENGVDTCQGDSGGPLVCLVNSQATLVGITSWGKGCGDTPGLYSDVGKVRQWIESEVSRYV